MQKTIEIWISERGTFSAFPKPAEAFPDWTKKLSRFVSFEVMRRELADAYKVNIPNEADIDFRPTLFGLKRADLVLPDEEESPSF